VTLGNMLANGRIGYANMAVLQPQQPDNALTSRLFPYITFVGSHFFMQENMFDQGATLGHEAYHQYNPGDPDEGNAEHAGCVYSPLGSQCH